MPRARLADSGFLRQRKMKYHVEKHGINKWSWAVVGDDGQAKVEGLDERTARHYCGLLNAQHNKTATP